MKRFILFSLIGLFGFTACEDDYTPKPHAYARVDLPAHEYIHAGGEQWHCPYSFDFSKYSAITVDPKLQKRNCWYNIYYPRYKATLHLTYTDLNDDLGQHIEDSRKLAMKHISKAAQIEDTLIEFPDKNVYGIVYDFAGETASDMQFFLTDSTDHFLRGALYFRVRPNKDSLAPVITYIKQDISHLIGSLTWSAEKSADGTSTQR